MKHQQVWLCKALTNVVKCQHMWVCWMPTIVHPNDRWWTGKPSQGRMSHETSHSPISRYKKKSFAIFNMVSNICSIFSLLYSWCVVVVPSLFIYELCKVFIEAEITWHWWVLRDKPNFFSINIFKNRYIDTNSLISEEKD